MDMVHIYMLMEINMGLEFNIIVIIVYIKDNIFMVKKKEKEDIYVLKAMFMKANIKMIKEKDMVFSHLKEVINMKENLKIIFLIEKENIYCIQNYLNI